MLTPTGMTHPILHLRSHHIVNRVIRLLHLPQQMRRVQQHRHLVTERLRQLLRTADWEIGNLGDGLRRQPGPRPATHKPRQNKLNRGPCRLASDLRQLVVQPPCRLSSLGCLLAEPRGLEPLDGLYQRVLVVQVFVHRGNVLVLLTYQPVFLA